MVKEEFKIQNFSKMKRNTKGVGEHSNQEGADR